MGKKPFTRKESYDKFAVQFKKIKNHRSNAMKIMAATFNGVAPSRDDTKTMPNIKKLMQIIPNYLKIQKLLLPVLIIKDTVSK